MAREPADSPLAARVVIADDAPVLCAIVRSVLEAAGAEVIAEASESGALQEALSGGRPNLLIIDSRFPPLGAAREVGFLKDAAVTCAVIVLAALDEIRLLRRAPELASVSFCERPIVASHLVETARRLLAN